MNEERNWRVMFAAFKTAAQPVSPRDKETLEVEDWVWKFEPYQRFMNFESRKLNLNYIREEIKWYLNGNWYDHSILKHAKIWKDHLNPDGKINSNYGYYLFSAPSFYYVCKVLRTDKWSRRAIVSILDRSHLYVENKDIPCTCTIGFRIRNIGQRDQLNCTVHMRSQDIIYGLGNDLPFFSLVQEMVLKALEWSYPKLVLGNLTIHVDSLHVYEKHYDMLEKLASGDKFTPIEVPKLNSAEEVDILINPNLVTESFIPLPFYEWLHV